MTRDDTANVCQSDPGALELLHAVQPLKHTEQFVGIRHVKPDTVIAYVEDQLASCAAAADFDSGPRPGTCVFHRVRKQIQKNQAKQGRIALGSLQLSNFPLD